MRKNCWVSGASGSGAADQRAEIRAEAGLDLGEDQLAAEREVETVKKLRAAGVLALPGFSRALYRERMGDGRLAMVSSTRALDALQQRRDVQEIMRGGPANLVGELVEIGRERQDASRDSKAESMSIQEAAKFIGA